MKKINIYWCIILFLILFHSINNFFWIKKDCNSGGCDVYNHSHLTLIMQRNLSEIFGSDRPVIESLRSAYRSLEIGAVGWPRLVHTIAAIVCFDSEDELFCIRYSNIIYFSLLLISIFLIGKKIHSPSAGLVAATFISLYPIVFGMSRKFGLDFPAMAMVSFVIFLLIDGNFYSRKFSLLLGISIGMCMLVKAQCVLFIGGPLLYVIADTVRDRKNRPCLKNVIMSMVITLFIGLIWWHRLFSYEGIREIKFHFFNDAISQYRNDSILNALTYYIASIYENMSPIFFGIFIVGMISTITQIRRKENIILILSFLPAYFVYSFLLPHTNVISTRYLLPAYGPLAVMATVGMMNVSNRKNLQRLIRALMILLIILGIYQFFDISYFRPGYPNQWFHSIKTNNHKIITEELNGTIQEFGLPENRIAIIENPDFAGDPSKLLCLYFMAADKKNELYLSCAGEIPSIIQEKFLSDAGMMDFLVTTSKTPDWIDLSGLEVFSRIGQKRLAAKVIKHFRSFKLVQRELLLPEKIYLILLSKY